MTASTASAVSAAALAAGAAWLLTVHGSAQHRLSRVCAYGREPDAALAARRVRAGARRLVARLLRSSRERRRRRTSVIALCFALADELQAGRTAAEALERATEVLTSEHAAELAPVVTASQTGGDVAAALRSASVRAGAEGFRRLAACWQVCSGSGAGFAPAVQRLAGGLRAEEEHRREIVAQLAGTRATTRLLGALPVLGLLMATGMGMRPFEFLLGTAPGFLCLGLGVALDVTGVFWTRSLAQRAEEAR